MFACILILILFLPVALLPCALATFFSSVELKEMGIHLEGGEAADFPPNAEVALGCICVSI